VNDIAIRGFRVVFGFPDDPQCIIRCEKTSDEPEGMGRALIYWYDSFVLRARWRGRMLGFFPPSMFVEDDDATASEQSTCDERSDTMEKRVGMGDEWKVVSYVGK